MVRRGCSRRWRTEESEEERQISVMKYSVPGGHQETDISRVRCHQIYRGYQLQSSSKLGDVPSLYVYGFMKISSEEDHHQDTLWIATTTANSRKNSTFNSETPREGRASDRWVRTGIQGGSLQRLSGLRPVSSCVEWRTCKINIFYWTLEIKLWNIFFENTHCQITFIRSVSVLENILSRRRRLVFVAENNLPGPVSHSDMNFVAPCRIITWNLWPVSQFDMKLYLWKRKVE